MKTTTKPRAKGEIARCYGFAYCSYIGDRVNYIIFDDRAYTKTARRWRINAGWRCGPIVAIDLPAPVEKKRGRK